MTSPPPGQSHQPPYGWAPPPVPPRSQRPPRPQPTRGPRLWREADYATRVILVVFAAVTPVIIGLTLIVTMTGRSAGQRDSSIDVSLTRCEFTGLTATVEYLVSNSGGRDRTVTLRWEYRDSSGARVDTDQTRVRVPAGDTVRGSEATILDADASSGTCRLVDIG